MGRLLPWIFPLLAVTAVGLVWLVFVQSGGLQTINEAIENRSYPDGEDGATVFTGLRTVDDTLMSLVAFNLPVVHATFVAGRVFMGQFLANIMIIPFILSIEARRGGRRWALSPVIWGLMSQLGTSAVALPLYCLYQCLRKDAVAHNGLDHTSLSSHSVLSTFLGVLLAYALPAWMMFNPFGQSPYANSLWTLAFALFPLGIAIASEAVSLLMRLLCPRPRTRAIRSDDHHCTLQACYAFIAIAAAAGHGLAICRAMEHPRDILSTILSLNLSPDHLRDQVLTFFKMDYLLTSAALLAWVFIELRKVGSIRGCFSLTMVLALGTVALGPGATTAIAWFVREERLRLSRPKTA